MEIGLLFGSPFRLFMRVSGFTALGAPAFHAGNTGSNPVGDAKKIQEASSSELASFCLAGMLAGVP
jgi:hypothetical protein